MRGALGLNTLSPGRTATDMRAAAGAFAGLLHVTVHSIKGFQDTAGFMDKTDPYVSLKVGNDQKKTRTLDNVGGSVVFAETLTFADKQLFQNLMRVQVCARTQPRTQPLTPRH